MFHANRSLTASAAKPLGFWLLALAAAALAVMFAAYAAVSPDDRPQKLVYLSVAASLAVFLTPQVFVAASLLVFAVSTSMSAPLLPSLPVAVYLSDLVVLLIAFRGALPRDRVPSNRALAGVPSLLFALWALVMAIAAVRGMTAGVSLASAIRADTALVYWPLLYFGYSRVLRERELKTSQLWRNLAYVALGLASWMFLARILNRPFEDPGLGVVPTGEGEVVRRNFGFAAAFVVYPPWRSLVSPAWRMAGVFGGGVAYWPWSGRSRL